MTVVKITATKECIVLALDSAVCGEAVITARVPLVCGDKAKKADEIIRRMNEKEAK